MAKLKILVLGGNGFIGRHILKYLSKNKKIKLYSTKYSSSKKKIKGVEYFKVKKNDYFSDKKNKLYKYSYDFIINASGYISNNNFFKDGDKIFNQHISSLINLIYNLKINSKITIINLGSSHEYMVNNNKLSEQNYPKPISFYGYCKSFLSMLPNYFEKNSDKVNLIHLRLFQIYGEGQREPRLLPYIINRKLENKISFLDSPSSKRDFLHIDDFTKLIEKIINFKNLNNLNILNIGSGKTTKIQDIANILNNLDKDNVPIKKKK